MLQRVDDYAIGASIIKATVHVVPQGKGIIEERVIELDIKRYSKIETDYAANLGV